MKVRRMNNAAVRPEGEFVKIMKRLHLPKYPPRQGGMDVLLRLHQAHDENVLGLLRYSALPCIGFNPAIPFVFQRRALRKLVTSSKTCDTSLYYNCWGADQFSSVDHAPVRIGYVHNHFPNFERYIKHFSQFLDGFLTVNPATTELARTILRGSHPEESIQTVPLPITPPNLLPHVERTSTIGVIGRVNYEQKGLNRLPDLARILQRSFPNLRIEVLGKGEKLGDLRKNASGVGNITFTRWCVGDEYWRKLSSWKAVLFLSHYEGLPISLLEAIHAGCAAVYPDFHDGDEQGLPLVLYKKGDLDEAARAIQKAFSLPSTPPPSHTSESEYLRAFDEQMAKMKPVERGTARRPTNPKWANAVRYNAFYKALTLGKT